MTTPSPICGDDEDRTVQPPMNIAVAGATGRVGRHIVEVVLIAPGVERFGYFRHLQRIALGQEPADSLAPEQDRYDVHFTDNLTWTTTRRAELGSSFAPGEDQG